MNIAFASTGYGPLWAPAVSSWLRVMGYTARYMEINHIGKICGAGVTDRTYTHTAENTLVEEFLRNPEATHLFMTEMDMILPHDCLIKLTALDKDMACGLYFLRSDIPEMRGQPCLYKRAPMSDWIERLRKKSNEEYLHTPISLFPKNEPFKADCAGVGGVLVKRHVFEKLEYPWFDLKAGDNRGRGYGSDMYFYTHTRKAGFELWVDPTVRYGQIDYYVTDIQDYEWQLENNPGFASRGFIVGTQPK